MTNQLTRRGFLSAGVAAASSAVRPVADLAAGIHTSSEAQQRKFYAILSVGRLGFEANFKEFEPFVGDEVKEIAVRATV